MSWHSKREGSWLLAPAQSWTAAMQLLPWAVSSGKQEHYSPKWFFHTFALIKYSLCCQYVAHLAENIQLYLAMNLCCGTFWILADRVQSVGATFCRLPFLSRGKKVTAGFQPVLSMHQARSTAWAFSGNATNHSSCFLFHICDSLQCSNYFQRQRMFYIRKEVHQKQRQTLKPRY